MAQTTLYICLIWMYGAVWGGYQPQPWCCGIIFTLQVTLTSQIWGRLGRCNGILVHPYSLETTYQYFKHFIYVYYGCMKWSWISASTMMLWHHVHSTSDLTSQIWGQLGWCSGIRVHHMPLRQHTNGSNTLYMSNEDVGSSLRWISASTVTQWHHFYSSQGT